VVDEDVDVVDGTETLLVEGALLEVDELEELLNEGVEEDEDVVLVDETGATMYIFKRARPL
jgi:predicted lipoprotein with Yx(FWY)xxD motif